MGLFISLPFRAQSGSGLFLKAGESLIEQFKNNFFHGPHFGQPNGNGSQSRLAQLNLRRHQSLLSAGCLMLLRAVFRRAEDFRRGRLERLEGSFTHERHYSTRYDCHAPKRPLVYPILGTRWTAPAFMTATTGDPNTIPSSCCAPRVTMATSGNPQSILTWTMTP
jgi:hypothetical protein